MFCFLISVAAVKTSSLGPSGVNSQIEFGTCFPGKQYPSIFRLERIRTTQLEVGIGCNFLLIYLQSKIEGNPLIGYFSHQNHSGNASKLWIWMINLFRVNIVTSIVCITLMWYNDLFILVYKYWFSFPILKKVTMFPFIVHHIII